MPRYVDGFVLPLPRKNLPAYRRMATKASRIWKRLGALEYYECVGDDLNAGMGMPFPKGIRVKKGETVVFSWVIYKNRAHRDRVNAKIMKDPGIAALMQGGMPFDVKRMLYGGFKTIAIA